MTDASDGPDPRPGGGTPPFSSGGAAAGILDAATVVVVRTRAGAEEILMLQRSAKSPFMPSTLVFPGGRLDAGDGPRERPASWEAAARRECEEEAGLSLRDTSLSWFDTWLTPSAEPRRRYLARFFVATVPAHAGDDARADGHETEGERWATVEAHLAEWDAGRTDLPPPTLSILLRMRDAKAAGGSITATGRADDTGLPVPILPKYVPIDGRHVVVMPHDPEYDALPGDGVAAPHSRLHGLPHRFVRGDTTWRPW